MADTFNSSGFVSPSDPALGAIAIDFSSDQTFTKRIRKVYLSTAGTLKVDMAGGTTVSLILAAGVWHPIEITKIYNSGSASAVGFVFY